MLSAFLLSESVMWQTLTYLRCWLSGNSTFLFRCLHFISCTIIFTSTISQLKRVAFGCSDCCCRGRNGGKSQQPLVHRPQVYHRHYCGPGHSSSLHPQRDWLSEVCQVSQPFIVIWRFLLHGESNLFREGLVSSHVVFCSALSVIGTWYVTIVVIVRYIWPDKKVTPAYIPTR